MRRFGRVVVTAFALVLAACSAEERAAAPSTTPAPATAAPGAESPSGTPTTTPTPSPTTVAPDACGAKFLSTLNQRQKLAQLLTVGVTGTADAAAVVRNFQVGGIFIGSWTDESLLGNHEIDQVSAATPVPLMVTVDEEGGRVSRLADLIGPAPSARVAAQTMTVQQAYQKALDRGRQMRALGVTVDFAPDVDVSSQPDDSVIGDRSYSDDPAVVTQYADAVIRGLHDAGLGAVIKHFPGHGSGSGDSHTGAVTTPPLSQLQNHDLVPFRSLIGSGAAVMVGHLDVPGLTTPGIPASISPQAMGLLRSGSGYGAAPFGGVIFTDDLGGMAAITDRMTVPDAVEAALVAGADEALWISTGEVPAVLDQLDQAVASGRLSPQRVDESVLRVARYKGALRC